MRYLADSSQMKRADQYTIQEAGIPSLELMERAAASCVKVMEEEELDLSKPCVVITAATGSPSPGCFLRQGMSPESGS